MIDVRSFEKNKVMEKRTVRISLTADIKLTKNVLMARMIPRKPCLREVINEAISLAKPVTREVKNLLIEVRRFEKRETTETKSATKPFLTATGIFLTAEKNFLMARNSIRGRENDTWE